MKAFHQVPPVKTDFPELVMQSGMACHFRFLHSERLPGARLNLSSGHPASLVLLPAIIRVLGDIVLPC